MKESTVIIGEGPTEVFYFNSLKDEYRELRVQPSVPKHSSLEELEKKIELCIENEVDHIYCVIDMDNKDNKTEKEKYQRLKQMFHLKKHGVSTIEFFETERCTELFFLFYYAYTTKRFDCYHDMEKELHRYCPYEKRIEFFKKHPLHQWFKKNGGELSPKAIQNALQSIRSKGDDGRTYTFSEIGNLFVRLGIV